MKIIVENSISRLVTGGPDLLVDPNLLYNIRDYMSIDVPGAFFSPQYKKRVWDGKKYYITPRGKFSTGHLPILLSFLEEEYKDLKVEILDEREGKVTFNEEIDTKVGDYSMEGEFEHQTALVSVFNNSITFRGEPIYFPRGIVDAATNAGKTTVIAGIYLNAKVANKNMLIIIHRKVIYKQLVDFMGEVFGEVGQINDQYYDIKPVTVAMAQSLVNRVKEGVVVRNHVKLFKILAVDECHRSSSKTYANILKYSDAYCRVFLSGTALDSSDVISKLDIIKHSGPKLAEVTKVELMQKGVSTPVGVRLHLCNTMLYKEPAMYQEYIDECIYYSSERVAIMRQLIENAAGPTMVAVDKIQHGQYIYDRLCDSNKKIVFTHGQDRQQLQKVQQFKDGEFDVLISTSILSEGVNLPKVMEIIYAPGGKSKISVKQWMGRLERLSYGKDNAAFHDMYDVGKYIKAHSNARIKIYQDENLPVFSDFSLKDAKKMSQILV